MNLEAAAWFALFEKGHKIADYKGFCLVGCNGDGLKMIQTDSDGKVARFIRKQLKLVCRCVTSSGLPPPHPFPSPRLFPPGTAQSIEQVA